YDDARMKIYSVSTRYYFAFGALISEEDSDKLKVLPGVRWVLPDSYSDLENKQYDGEPFVDGKAVPYDPKYHEVWIRNHARAYKRQEKRKKLRARDEMKSDIEEDVEEDESDHSEEGYTFDDDDDDDGEFDKSDHAAAVIPTSSRAFSTCETTSSLNDPNPDWSNKLPKETILLDGCDFEHWLIVVEKPEGEPTRDEIIDSYINTLAKALGLSYDDARMKIYSVSTRCYYAFGALVSEEDSYKLKGLPGVRWVLPDSYLDVENKQYEGEPFIDGKAVPYDPKYHEEWIRNHCCINLCHA
ncbi:multiple organellar RNA editing factor 8, chloroplastic/mitochondrial-like protein, partial [Tanacetum coccineum]